MKLPSGSVVFIGEGGELSDPSSNTGQVSYFHFHTNVLEEDMNPSLPLHR